MREKTAEVKRPFFWPDLNNLNFLGKSQKAVQQKVSRTSVQRELSLYMQTGRQTLIKVTVFISRACEDASRWLSYTKLVRFKAVMRVVRVKAVCPLYWCNDCPDVVGRLSRSWTPHVSTPDSHRQHDSQKLCLRQADGTGSVYTGTPLLRSLIFVCYTGWTAEDARFCWRLR